MVTTGQGQDLRIYLLREPSDHEKVNLPDQYMNRKVRHIVSGPIVAQ